MDTDTKVSDALKAPPMPERENKYTHLFLAGLFLALALAYAYLNKNALRDQLVIEEKHKAAQCLKDEYAVAVAQGGDVGKTVRDRRRLSDAEILAVISAQFLDRDRSSTFDSALYSEITRVQQRIARSCEAAQYTYTKGL